MRSICSTHAGVLPGKTILESPNARWRPGGPVQHHPWNSDSVHSFRGGRQATFRPRLLGFRPRWAKDKSPTPINARIESLKTPYFRDSFSHQRCVIPASGWYEWVKTADGKQPYYITCSNLGRDEALMFAGIYTPTGIGTGVRAAIITEPAADPISHIHDRQPALIDPQSLDSWLDPGLTHVGQLRGKVGRADPGRLEWWPVSTRVNRADAQNDSSLIEPLESQET